MIKLKFVLLSMFFLSSAAMSPAQVKKTTKADAEVIDDEDVPEMIFDDMLPSTAQILVIDSVVVDKADFLNKIPLDKEAGQLSTYDKLTGTTGQPWEYTFVNGFGNKMFFAQKGDDGHYQLFSADKLGDEWTNVKRVDDFGEELEDFNYPFMMSDGTTLYFAAKGKGGLGGYDIYVTRYDISSEKFYTPENVGLPYNSKGNDYYCIIDDFNELGWLVTDRRQPEGKVCIYTFVPQKGRKVYDEENIDENKLYGLAELTRIKDTWTNEGELQAARKRLAKLYSRSNDVNRNSISFIVNDQTVYTSLNDFKSATNRSRFAKLAEMKASADALAKKLDALRIEYSNGTRAAKRQLSSSILKSERQLEELQTYIHALEKEIRNTENMIKR